MRKFFFGFLIFTTLFPLGVAMSKHVDVSEPKTLTIDPKKHYEAVIATDK